MNEICEGEPVTYLIGSEDGVHIVRSFIAKGNYWLGSGVMSVTSTRHPALLDPVNEGSHWIRRHHRDNSEEVAALLAAYKLTRSAA